MALRWEKWPRASRIKINCLTLKNSAHRVLYLSKHMAIVFNFNIYERKVTNDDQIKCMILKGLISMDLVISLPSKHTIQYVNATPRLSLECILHLQIDQLCRILDLGTLVCGYYYNQFALKANTIIVIEWWKLIFVPQKQSMFTEQKYYTQLIFYNITLLLKLVQYYMVYTLIC